MRVLYLTTGCFDKGGISRYNRYQIRALRELLGSHNVLVHSLNSPDEEAFEDPFAVTSHSGGLSKASKLHFIAKVIGSAISNGPRIILTAHVNFSGLATVLGKVLRAKTILNVYGVEVWSGLRPDAAWGLKSIDHVIADCHFTARYLEDEGIRTKGSTAVAWDCVDLDRFHPGPVNQRVLDKYGIPDPRTGVNLLTLGRMGNLDMYKGYGRLLDVLNRLRDELPDLRLIYAGRGTLVEELRSRAKAIGLENRVFFTGMVHEAELADVYRSAHIFSLVSDRGVLRGEGIPLTPLEAGACGIPILVGNHDGSQEAVVEGVNGYILNPFDIESHAAAVRRIAREPELGVQMGKAAFTRIRDDFAYPIFVRRHREILAKWLGAEFERVSVKGNGLTPFEVHEKSLASVKTK